eukprot:716787-Amphidinium_carterae.1
MLCIVLASNHLRFELLSDEAARREVSELSLEEAQLVICTIPTSPSVSTRRQKPRRESHHEALALSLSNN